MSKKWLITNTSRKKNPKTTRDKVGVPLSVRIIRAGKEETVDIAQDQSALTESLTEGHLKFLRSDLISIREIGDVSVLLEERTKQAGSKTDTSKPSSAQAAMRAQEKLKSLKAMATPMGQNSSPEKESKKTEDSFTARPRLKMGKNNTDQNNYTASPGLERAKAQAKKEAAVSENETNEG